MESIGTTKLPSTPLRLHEAERPLRPDVRARRQARVGGSPVGMVRALRALLGRSGSSGSYGGVRGKGVRTGARFPQWMYAQRVVVKARVVKNRGINGRQTMRDHVNYLKRDGVDQEGGEGRPFNDEGFLSSEQSDAFVVRSADDRHHFRFILSPERGADLDLTEYARDLMSQAERDLGTSLQWMGVVHHNTDNPHVHIVVRGIDERAADLVISREYISRGLRERGQEIATRELGLRVEQEVERQRAQELRADRPTPMDRVLEREAQAAADGVIDVRPPASRTPYQAVERLRLEKIARLHHLENLGLASESATGRWELAGDAMAKLQELGAGERLSTSFFRFVERSYRFESIKLYEKAKPDAPSIKGEIVGRGKLEEFDEHDVIFVASNLGATAGRVYRLALGPFSESPDEPLRVGQQVELLVHRRQDVSAADQNIIALAASHGGEYSAERHRDFLEGQARRGRFALEELEERLERHVRRIESHERRGFVKGLAPGVWRVPVELRAQLEEYGKTLGDRRLTPRVVPASPLSLAEQVRARGPTWLDGQLALGAQLQTTESEEWSAPERLRDALRQRTEFLKELGVEASGRPLRPAELESLYRLEISETAQRLNRGGELGRFLVQDELPQRMGPDGREVRAFEGQISTITPLMSGRHVVLIGSGEFTILPVSPASRLAKDGRVSAVLNAPTRMDPARAVSAQSRVQYTVLQRSREIQRGRELGD